jgi:hypothetical protein
MARCFHAPHPGWHHPEPTSRLLVQVDRDEWHLRIGDGETINEEQQAPPDLAGHRDHLVDGQTGEDLVADERQVRSNPSSDSATLAAHTASQMRSLEKSVRRTSGRRAGQRHHARSLTPRRTAINACGDGASDRHFRTQLPGLDE